MNSRCLIAILFSALGLSAIAAALSPIREASEVLQLSRASAGTGHPVQLRGTVTYFKKEGNYSDLVIQDETGGVFISGAHLLQMPDLKPGTRVEVKGDTESGSFAPAVRARSVERIGEGALPEPPRVSYDELRSGKFHCRYVEIPGIVRSASLDQAISPPRQLLRVATGSGFFDAWVLRFNEAEGSELIGAAVRVRGVCLAWENSRRQNTGLRLVVNDLSAIQIEQPAPPDPFDAPLVAFDDLLRYRPDGFRQQQVRVRGVVTWSRPGDSLVLQNDRLGIRIDSSSPDLLRVGDEVEAVGFPEAMGYTAGLRDARYRVISHPGAIDPEEIAVRKVSGGHWAADPDQKLIRVRGALRALQQDAGHINLLMEEEGCVFPAILPLEPSSKWGRKLEPGSLLELTGVCDIRPSERQRRIGGRPDGFALLLRDSTDVRVLRPGPWLNQSRFITVLTVSAGALSLALLWAFTLRRMVARRGAQVVEEIRARHDAEVEFNAVSGERNRVAAELHDTLAQSLTGIALQLQAATLAGREEPVRATEHVATARDLLARSREDLRRSVWGLRNGHDSKRDLAAELREIGTEFNGSGGPSIQVKLSGDLDGLKDLVIHHAVRFSQEAVTNSVRHARAREIVVSVNRTPERLLLRIADDGIGFSPEEVSGATDGHFGLLGMRERAQRLGATLALDGAVGKGTTITLDIPL